MLAAAPRDRLGFRKLDLQRREAGALVGTVAERLALGMTTGAKETNAWLLFEHQRRALKDFRFGHKK
jgi:hypothetical protein